MRSIKTVIDGHFWTADPNRPWAKSLAIDDAGRIARIETDPKVFAEAFPAADNIQLPVGSLGIPAFHDAHNHWGFAAFSHAEPLNDAVTSAMIIQRLGARSDASQDGWIIGFGWNTGVVGGLSSSDLDRVSTTRPIAVFDKSTHAVQLNAVGVQEIDAAFQIAKAEGHPGTLEGGRLLESSFLVFGTMRLPASALESSLLDLDRTYRSLGIASVDDLDVLSPQVLESLQSLYAARKLTLPCHAFIDFGRFRGDAIPEPTSTGLMSIVGMKSYMDGAFGARSAAMREPFIGVGGSGVRMLDEPRFRRRATTAVEHGYRRIALHAIGDQAVSDATRFLTAIAGDHRFDRLRIEHFQLASEVDRRRCADAGIAVCMQPNFTSDVVDYADRLGERSMRLCEHRSVVKSGALLGFGSDGMPTGPLHGVRCATEHPNEGERLTIEEALRAYTIDACRISLTDDVRGSLSLGKEANIAVLNQNIVEKGRIALDAEVIALFHEGAVSFDARRNLPRN